MVSPAAPLTLARATSFSATAPNVPRLTATLVVTARIEYPFGAGSNTVLAVEVNGQRVDDLKRRGLGRLINRELVTRVSSAHIYSSFSNGLWRLPFEPTFASHAAYYEGDPFTLVLDVTDLLQTAGANQVRITNRVPASTDPQLSGNIVVSALSLRWQSSGPQSPMMQPQRVATDVVNAGSDYSRSAPYSVTRHPGGGFSLTTGVIGARTWSFTSAYSYPAVGFNLLTPTTGVDGSGQPGWSVTTTPTETLARAQGYSIRRTLELGADKVTVRDSITNTSAVELPLVVRNEVSLAGAENSPVRLAGYGDATFNVTQADGSTTTLPVNDFYSPGNPTVYVEGLDHGLGLVAEDDLFRNQVRLYVRPGPDGTPRAGLKTEMLLIPAGQSRTLEWSVYPVAGVDHFDFINLVRRDWGSNLTTDGPWYWGFGAEHILFSSPTLPDLMNPAYGIRYASHGSWVDFLDTGTPKRLGFGAAPFSAPWATYSSFVTAANDAIHTSAPGVKVLVYFDEQRDSTPSGTSLFADSARTRIDGTQDSVVWPPYQRVYSVVPISGPTYAANSFGTEMLSVANRYGTELHADGLYIDELEDVSYGEPLVTFNRLDGSSAFIDPLTLTTSARVGLTQLLARDHHEQLLAGRVVLGNGPSYVRSTMRAQRMVEAQHNDLWPSQGHLQTPLAYLAQARTFSAIQRLLTFGLLPVGTISTDWAAMGPAMKRMFPATPIELHMGYLLAEERIITAHSGSYGWPGSNQLVRPFFFDASGAPTTDGWQSTLTASGEVRTRVDLPTETGRGRYDGHLAVLERLPVRVHGDVCTIDDLAYSPEEVSMTISSKSPVQVELEPGEFPISAGRSYRVERDGKVETAVAAGTPPRLSLCGVRGRISVRPEAKK